MSGRSETRRRWAQVVCGCCLGLLVACGRPGPAASQAPEPASSLAQEAAAAATGRAVDTSPYVSRLPVIAPQVQPVAPQVAPFTWQAEPSAGLIPSLPVTGSLRGKPFIGRRAAVSVAEEDQVATWRLRLSSLPRPPSGSFSLDDDAVTVQWHEPAGVGQWRKTIAEPRPPGCDAWFVVEQADGSPLTSSPEFGCLLRIDSVTGPTEVGGAPSLQGRLVVLFDDPEKSWVAGRFVADGCR